MFMSLNGGWKRNGWKLISIHCTNRLRLKCGQCVQTGAPYHPLNARSDNYRLFQCRASLADEYPPNMYLRNAKCANTQVLVEVCINPCPAELFQIIFHSFKAGIANAISSFKWRKTVLFMKNKHIPNWNIWLAEHLPLNILKISVVFYLGWHFLENVYFRVQQDKG